MESAGKEDISADGQGESLESSGRGVVVAVVVAGDMEGMAEAAGAEEQMALMELSVAEVWPVQRRLQTIAA